MAEKDKSVKTTTAPPKNVPKDAQVIMCIMKEMGITEYDPKTVIQLADFVYRYATSILEEARTFANNSKKKFIDLEDVRLALHLSSESSFTLPPPREVILECSRNKNNTPLPVVKPHCGLRLPSDRFCLSGCNYSLKNVFNRKKTSLSGGSALKLVTKPTVSYIKRTNPVVIPKQTITIPKPTLNVVTTTPGQQVSQNQPLLMQQQRTIVKPKIQITSNVVASSNAGGGAFMDVENSLKRKREDEDDGLSINQP